MIVQGDKPKKVKRTALEPITVRETAERIMKNGPITTTLARPQDVFRLAAAFLAAEQTIELLRPKA